MDSFMWGLQSPLVPSDQVPWSLPQSNWKEPASETDVSSQRLAFPFHAPAASARLCPVPWNGWTPVYPTKTKEARSQGAYISIYTNNIFRMDGACVTFRLIGPVGWSGLAAGRGREPNQFYCPYTGILGSWSGGFQIFSFPSQRGSFSVLSTLWSFHMWVLMFGRLFLWLSPPPTTILGDLTQGSSNFRIFYEILFLFFKESWIGVW